MTSQYKEIQKIAHLLDARTPEDIDKLEKQLAPVLLCWYASIGDLSNITALVNLGVDLNAQDYDHRTALHLASAECQLPIIDMLLLHTPKLLADKNGETAFHDAVRSYSAKTVQILKKQFEKGAEEHPPL